MAVFAFHAHAVIFHRRYFYACSGRHIWHFLAIRICAHIALCVVDQILQQITCLSPFRGIWQSPPKSAMRLYLVIATAPPPILSGCSRIDNDAVHCRSLERIFQHNAGYKFDFALFYCTRRIGLRHIAINHAGAERRNAVEIVQTQIDDIDGRFVALRAGRRRRFDCISRLRAVIVLAQIYNRNSVVAFYRTSKTIGAAFVIACTARVRAKFMSILLLVMIMLAPPSTACAAASSSSRNAP